MRRALPAIAVSAAGVTWLLHAQGVIDAAGAPGSTSAPTSGAAAPSPTARAGATSPTTSVPGAATTPSTTAPPGRRTPSSTTPSTTAPATTDGGGSGSGTTVTGPSVSTRFGPVQVAVVVSDGKVTDIKTLQSPSSARRSQQINNRALPILRQEAVAAQSSNIDSVSGATITSDAYATSLQAALDQAGLR